jgi:hypothetical protein
MAASLASITASRIIIITNMSSNAHFTSLHFTRLHQTNAHHLLLYMAYQCLLIPPHHHQQAKSHGAPYSTFAYHCRYFELGTYFRPCSFASLLRSSCTLQVLKVIEMISLKWCSKKKLILMSLGFNL